MTAILVFLGAGSAFAQLRWQGEVNSPVMLRIRGDRVDFDTRYVANPTVQFQSPLPADRTRVTVNVLQGRGQARVVDQPNRGNNYTATVSLDPRRGREFMAVEVVWDNSGHNSGYDNNRYRRRDDAYGAAPTGYNGAVNWRGQVDHEAIIEFRGNRAQVRTVQGRPVYGANVNFSAPLPRADVNVQLSNVRGRGQVQLIESPNAGNGYTARVRIVDDQEGAGDYFLTLAWDGNAGYYSNERRRGSTGVFDNYGDSRGGQYSGGNRMVWAGRVDGRVRVIVQGNRSWVETLSGRPPEGVHADFGAPLPAANMNVRVDRRQGRNDVRLVERPSPANGYRVVFEIDDDDSGADFYQVEVSW